MSTMMPATVTYLPENRTEAIVSTVKAPTTILPTAIATADADASSCTKAFARLYDGVQMHPSCVGELDQP